MVARYADDMLAGSPEGTLSVRGVASSPWTTVRSMATTNVYVDAFNLYYGALKSTAGKWLDLDALCHRLLPNDQIHRIRYFTAYASARPGDPQQPQRQLTYLRALETIPHLSIHLGHYLSHPTRMRLARPAPG